jgi:uncharacterized membrane protein YphA (DoxX/SURF4 family)
MKTYLPIFLRVVVSAILLQTLYFKFTGAEESKFIFSTLGVEPYGRWFAGVSELIASILVWIPGLNTLGALMSAGIMAGALLSHLTLLGIVVQDDGGLLFGLALIVLVASLGLIALGKNQILMYIEFVKKFRSAEEK